MTEPNVQNDNTEKLKEDTVTAKKMLDVEQSKIPPGGTGCSILDIGYWILDSTPKESTINNAG